MISHAVVLATRLALDSGNKLGSRAVARVRQTLEHLATLGIRNVAVVDGRHAAELRERLNLHDLPKLDVRVLANLSWKNLSGSAVLLAKEWIGHDQACLVVRGDRPDLESMRLLVQAASQRCSDAAIMVAATPEENRGSESRVKLERDGSTDLYTVADIGEDLEDADGVFTGHAVVRRSILEALSSLPNPTLEHGLLELVQKGRVVALLRPSWPWDGRLRIDVEDNVTALLEAKRHGHYVLLNPGPVNTTATVKSALVHHDVCHRDPIFSELMVSLTGKLRRIFRGTPQHTVVAITGSGTAAMESALVSTVPHDRKILIVDNGAFGARLVEVAKVHDMDIVHLRYGWGETVDPADVERALEQYPDIAVVAMIHHETSVGLLNPIGEIGAVCRRFDALTVVDCVSSLGAEDIDVVRDNIDICYSSANKCLHAVSGASFMCVSPRVWSRIETLQPKSYYLDLRRYRRYMDELAQTPFTPAVSVYFALDAACGEFLADGHTKRFEMYRSRNSQLRRGLAQLGMRAFTQTGAESSSIVTCELPEGISFDALYDAVKGRGIIVYGCKGILAERYMQIANMGHLGEGTIAHFLTILGEEIARLRAESSASRSVSVASVSSLPGAAEERRRAV